MSRLLSAAMLLLAVSWSNAAPPAASAVAYQPGGKLVAFGTHGEVRLFDSQTGDLARKFTGHTGRVTALEFAPNGLGFAAASGEPGKAGVVRLHALNESGTITLNHPDVVYALAFSPDGKRLATAGYDRVIRVYEFAAAGNGTVEPKLTLKDHSDTIYGLAFHPDGKLLASAAADRAVKVWDADTGTRLYTLSDSTDWVYSLAWSPDKKHLAAGGVDKSVRVWAADRDGGKLVQSVFAHEKAVWRIAYTGDGKALYSVGEDRVIKAWDAAKLVETRVFPAQPDTVLALAVRPDGKQLAVGRFDGTAVLLDAASDKVIAQVLPAKPIVPKPEKLTPNAAVRGTTTRITVTGKNLDEVKTVSSPLGGVAAKLLRNTADGIEIEVTIPAHASAGAAQLTFEGEAGKSAPLALAIDRYPAIPEAGLTESARKAQPIKLPTTVAGAIDRAGDVDYYRFDAAVGQQVGVQVVAAELGSKLDPTLVLTDIDGTVLAEGTGGLLGYTVTKAAATPSASATASSAAART